VGSAGGDLTLFVELYAVLMSATYFRPSVSLYPYILSITPVVEAKEKKLLRYTHHPSFSFHHHSSLNLPLRSLVSHPPILDMRSSIFISPTSRLELTGCIPLPIRVQYPLLLLLAAAPRTH